MTADTSEAQPQPDIPPELLRKRLKNCKKARTFRDKQKLGLAEKDRRIAELEKLLETEKAVNEELRSALTEKDEAIRRLNAELASEAKTVSELRAKQLQARSSSFMQESRLRGEASAVHLDSGSSVIVRNVESTNPTRLASENDDELMQFDGHLRRLVSAFNSLLHSSICCLVGTIRGHAECELPDPPARRRHF